VRPCNIAILLCPSLPPPCPHPYVSCPLSASHHACTIQSLALLEARGLATSQRFLDVSLVVQAQLEHRRGAGQHLPVWALAALDARAPAHRPGSGSTFAKEGAPAAPSGVSLSGSYMDSVCGALATMQDYHKAVTTRPLVIATADAIARPRILPAKGGKELAAAAAAIVEAKLPSKPPVFGLPGWSRRGAGLAFAGPASADASLELPFEVRVCVVLLVVR